MIQLIEAVHCGYSEELIEYVTNMLINELEDEFINETFVLEDGILMVKHNGKVLEV